MRKLFFVPLLKFFGMINEGSGNDISPLRPRSLTFLCYLTIFASLYMIMTSFQGILNPDEVVKRTEEVLVDYENMVSSSNSDPKALAAFEKAMSGIAGAITSSNMHDYSVFTLIFNCLTLVGAWIMLRLKKNGFKIYVLGNLIAVASSALVFGTDNWLGIAYACYHGFTGGIFILLYALKMKYME